MLFGVSGLNIWKSFLVWNERGLIFSDDTYTCQASSLSRKWHWFGHWNRGIELFIVQWNRIKVNFTEPVSISHRHSHSHARVRFEMCKNRRYVRRLNTKPHIPFKIPPIWCTLMSILYLFSFLALSQAIKKLLTYILDKFCANTFPAVRSTSSFGLAQHMESEILE